MTVNPAADGSRPMTQAEAQGFITLRARISAAKKHLEETRPENWRADRDRLNAWYADTAYLYGTNQVGDLRTVLPHGRCPGGWQLVPKSRWPHPDYVTDMMLAIDQLSPAR